MVLPLLIKPRGLRFVGAVYSSFHRVPNDSFLRRQFEYVSQPRSTEVQSLSHLNKNLNMLLEKLDQNFDDSKSIVNNETYSSAMSDFPKILEKTFASKDQLVKMLFYIGLQKKTKQAQTLTNNVLNSLQKNFDDLTLEDTCILASTVFRSSLPKINSRSVKLIADSVHKNLDHLLQNPADLVCLIKTLRQQRHHNFELLQNLADSSSVWLKSSITNRAHIMFYFAEALWCPLNYSDMFFNCIKDCDNGAQFREKDLSCILWAASVLGTDIGDRDAELIWRVINSKMESFQKNPEPLLNCVLSMATMGHFSSHFTKLISSPKVMEHFQRKNKPIVWVRLKKLQQILKIECGDDHIFEAPWKIFEPSADYQIKDRPDLRKVLFAVKCLAPKLQLTSVKCTFSIPTISNAGIEVVGNDKLMNIEVLDEHVCFRNTRSIPTGIMKLKLRLVEKLNHKTLIVSHDDLTLSDNDLFILLEEKMKSLLELH